MNAKLAQEPQLDAPVLRSYDQERSLADRVMAIHEMIARRAYHYFERRSHELGHDLEDWLRAESELLWPIAIDVYEFEDGMIVRAEAPLVSPEDIDVSVEPGRIIICDRDPIGYGSPYDARPSMRLCRILSLPGHLEFRRARIGFEDGILEIFVPKTSQTDPAAV